jgi:hypothetical protein
MLTEQDEDSVSQSESRVFSKKNHSTNNSKYDSKSSSHSKKYLSKLGYKKIIVTKEFATSESFDG